MPPTNQDFRVRLLYGNLKVEIISHFNEYIRREGHSLDQLKDRFGECLTERVKRNIQDVAQLVKALEKRRVMGKNDVKIIKLLAERIGLQALVDKIEKYEYDRSGIITKIFKGVAGAVKTSAIHLRAVLSCRGAQATELAAAVLRVFGINPETVQTFQTFLDLTVEVLALLPSSVVFVLKVSSIASIKRLWQGYKDGSLKKNMKKDLNEMKELKELSKGEEIDVELTIDEEEYREVYWNLILSEVKANDARQNDEKQPTLSRRHSIGCEQDVPKSSNLAGVSQLHIQAWRHIDELNKVLNYFKSIKAKKEASEDTAIALKEVISMVEQQEKRLSEIRQELSDLNIEIGFEKAKVEGKAELTERDLQSDPDTGRYEMNPELVPETITEIPHKRKRERDLQSDPDTGRYQMYPELVPETITEIPPQKRKRGDVKAQSLASESCSSDRPQTYRAVAAGTSGVTLPKVMHDKVERIDSGASTSLQAQKERKMAAVIGYSVEELNYFRACYVTTRIFPDKLRTLFKQEWDNRYQATYGTWQDTAKNGIDFYNMESPKRQKINARELAVIRNGNTCKWDCTCLFYAILSSDSVGKGLDPAVRKSVDHLRQFRNYVVHIPDGKLNESDFNSNIKKVITAFASLKLSTAGIEDINTQRLFPAEELRDIKEQLEKKEMRCVLPTKPNHQVIDRSDEIREIHTQMERLRSTKPNEITVIYLSGNPGCGKSEIARQVGEKLFKDASDHATKIFVFTLNASSHDTLIQSYVEFAISLKCDNNFVTSIQMSKDLSQEDKLELLQSIVAPKLQNYSASWLIIVDNVTEVNSVLRYLPQAGEKTEGKGQMLVTTQDSISISPDDSYAYHLSLSKGMSRKDALRMLSEISNIVDEEETTFEIAKALDFQPLALALAANYMKCLRITTPTFSWKEYRENLKQGKRQATEGESKRISVAYSQTMTAAVRLAVEKEMADGVMKLAFHFLSVEASKLMPLESVVQYVKRLIPDEDEELVAAHITSSSLILSSQNQSKEIGVHQVVHSCLQILFKVS